MATPGSEEIIGKAIEALSGVYCVIQKNEILKHELLRSSFPRVKWHELDELFAEGADSAKWSSDLFGLFDRMESMLDLVHVLVNEVHRSLNEELLRSSRSHPSLSRAMVEMTFANLEPNVRLLVDKLADLYVGVARMDEERNGRAKRIALRFPRLADPSAWSVTPAAEVLPRSASQTDGAGTPASSARLGSSFA